MKTEITYQWRIKWLGKWGNTRYHCTEEHVRKEHPEAICIESTRRELTVPETDKERTEQARIMSTSSWQKHHNPGGSDTAMR